MDSKFARLPRGIGEFDHGNGRRGTHPVRRNIAPGPPPWVRTPLVEPVMASAQQDALYGDRDRLMPEDVDPE